LAGIDAAELGSGEPHMQRIAECRRKALRDALRDNGMNWYVRQSGWDGQYDRTVADVFIAGAKWRLPEHCSSHTTG